VPRAQRSTRISNPGTVIINPPPDRPATPSSDDPAAKPKNFWEEQEILNTAEGKDYVIYLYRLQPATLGHKGYIAKYSQPVTIDEIKETFGGYEYRISLHKGSRWIAQDIFSVSAPPKAIGTADPAMFAGGNAAIAGSEATAQVSQVLQFVNDRLDRERREKANDPAYLASLDLVRESAKQAITSAYAANRNPAAESMQNQMMQMMMQQMGQVTSALLTRSLERPERSSVSGIRELLDLLPLLGVKVGGGGGGRMDPLAEIGRSLIGAAPQILEAGATFMDKYRMIAQERTRQAELQFNAVALSRGAQPVQVSTPAPAAPGPRPVPTAAPAPQPAAATAFDVMPFPETGTEFPEPAAAPATEFDADLVKRRIVDLISKGASGDFLMAFISGVNETFAQTMKVCSEEQIRTFFAADPVLAQALASPNFDQCLAEAIEYLHPPAEAAPAVH